MGTYRSKAKPNNASTARPLGRRPGVSTTRQQILTAARESFAQHGFDGTSLRAVAGRAGVDPALVRRFFGSKEDLLVAALTATISPGQRLQETLACPTENLGERLVDYFLTVWDEDPNQSVMLGMLRSACTNERAAELLRQFIAGQVLTALRQVLDPRDAQPRAALIGSQLVGLAIVRYVIPIEPLASASADELRTLIGPTLQRYLTGGLERPKPARS
jgi:AcrR family transcriptional regulator